MKVLMGMHCVNMPEAEPLSSIFLVGPVGYFTDYTAPSCSHFTPKMHYIILQVYRNILYRPGTGAKPVKSYGILASITFSFQQTEQTR